MENIEGSLTQSESSESFPLTKVYKVLSMLTEAATHPASTISFKGSQPFTRIYPQVQEDVEDKDIPWAKLAQNPRQEHLKRKISELKQRGEGLGFFDKETNRFLGPPFLEGHVLKRLERLQEQSVSCQPWSLLDFLDRIGTFQQGSFISLVSNPTRMLDYARYGWSRDGGKVKCVTCKEEFLVSQTEGDYEEKGHGVSCPWRYLPCSASLYKIPSFSFLSSKQAKEELLEQSHALLRLQPQIFSPLRHPLDVSKLPSDLQESEAIILILFGWYPFTKDRLRCYLCQRVIGCWNFQTTKDPDLPTFDVLAEHKDYCPYVTSSKENHYWPKYWLSLAFSTDAAPWSNIVPRKYHIPSQPFDWDHKKRVVTKFRTQLKNCISSDPGLIAKRQRVEVLVNRASSTVLDKSMIEKNISQGFGMLKESLLKLSLELQSRKPVVKEPEPSEISRTEPDTEDTFNAQLEAGEEHVVPSQMSVPDSTEKDVQLESAPILEEENGNTPTPTSPSPDPPKKSTETYPSFL